MKNRCYNFLRRILLVGMIPDVVSWRTAAILVVYSSIISFAIVFAFFMRFDFSFSRVGMFNVFHLLFLVLPIKLFFLVVFGQFKGMLTFFHIPDLIKIFWAMMCASGLIFVLNLFAAGNEVFFMPRGVVLSDFMLSVILLTSFRAGLRVYRERMMRDKVHIRTNKRVAIIGAGDVGTSLAADLLSRKNLGIQPVVFLDDDCKKIGLQILGLEVMNLKSDFATLARSYRIDRAIIAISNMSSARIGEITAGFSKLGIETSIVPSYFDLASGFAKVSNIREVAIEDVLGRDPVRLDAVSIDEMIKGKIVMVTGAGGSIGRELCRQIAVKAPSMLIMVDHCEVQLFQVEQQIILGEFGITIKPLVASVADENRMDFIISHYRPNLIFHAAAHKHVPMMESQPGEALKNNTFGTWNIASIASKYDVEKFLLISTDKAINPTNVMGATKRLAEMSVQAMQRKKGNKTQFVAVRFGNVLGSSGSVIPTFKRQIESGGPVTVTHPEVTRYFMTIPEAVGLVLQCASQAMGGEIFVLDMGEPVKVIDLARHMIRLSGFEPDIDIKIKIVGLRPGEKLYEELQHKNELLSKTGHPRIFGFVSEPPSYDVMKGVVDEIKGIADKRSVNELKHFIFKTVPEYKAQFYD